MPWISFGNIESHWIAYLVYPLPHEDCEFSRISDDLSVKKFWKFFTTKSSNFVPVCNANLHCHFWGRCSLSISVARLMDSFGFYGEQHQRLTFHFQSPNSKWKRCEVVCFFHGFVPYCFMFWLLCLFHWGSENGVFIPVVVVLIFIPMLIWFGCLFKVYINSGNDFQEWIEANYCVSNGKLSTFISWSDFDFVAFVAGFTIYLHLQHSRLVSHLLFCIYVCDRG